MLRLVSWPPVPRIICEIEYPWKGDTWYTIKLSVDVKDGKGIIAAKVWSRGESEPNKWNLTMEDPVPNPAGGPGVYAYSVAITSKSKGTGYADTVWKYDLIEELGVFPHNLATSSPLVLGDRVMLVTGNGVDEGHLNIPMQVAPSFAAFDEKSGELLWEYTVLERILHGQWSSPSAGMIDGKPQAIFPGGDGWVYALDPQDGTLIWRFNCNSAGSTWELGGYGTKNNIIATPVFADGRVYVGVGQAPEHGTGTGHLYCIDASGTGDVTATHSGLAPGQRRLRPYDEYGGRDGRAGLCRGPGWDFLLPGRQHR